MKKHPTLFILVIVLAIFLPSRQVTMSAQVNVLPNSNLTKYQRDSIALLNYLDSTIMHLSEPIVLSMTDTLFNMSAAMKDRKRQAIALSYKVDYYFINNIPDSLFAAIETVKDFSKEYNQFIYYYFAWQRKVSYFIRRNQFNMALNELNLMQKDAIANDYYPMQVSANFLLGRIYFSRMLYPEAKEYFAKAIKMGENAPKDIIITNMDNIYLGYAHVLSQLNEYNEMKSYLDKALTFAKTDMEKCSVYLVYCRYYLNNKNIDSCEYYLKLTEDLKYAQRSVNGNSSILLTKYDIASYKKDYLEEQRIIDTLQKHHPGYVSNLRIANTLEDNQDYKGAIQYLKKELQHQDSIRLADIRNELSETLIMMDVNRIKAEKDKADIEMRDRILLITVILSSVLFIAFVFILLIFSKYYRTHKKLVISDKNLCKAVIKLEEESRVKSDFLRHLSHEVRTPLNSIVGFSHILSDRFNTDPELAHCSKIIDESSQQLTKIIHDAVEIYNYGDKDIKTMTDINTFFDSAIEYMDIRVKKGVNLVHIPCQSLNHSFMVDSEKIIIILANLLHNSAKFTSVGKVVMETDVDIKSNQIIFSISDTGPGIPVSQQKNVFDYFIKVDTMSQGLGLGLSLSRHLAESMGGTLSIDSSYNIGCRMIVKIPYKSI